MNDIRPGEHICIVGTAHLDQKNPVYHMHEKLLLVLVLDRETGKILDCDVNVICNLTKQFIRAMYLDKNLVEDISSIQECIQKNYFGTSSKALVNVTKSVRARYLAIVKREGEQ